MFLPKQIDYSTEDVCVLKEKNKTQDNPRSI